MITCISPYDFAVDFGLNIKNQSMSPGRIVLLIVGGWEGGTKGGEGGERKWGVQSEITFVCSVHHSKQVNFVDHSSKILIFLRDHNLTVV